MKKKPLLVVIMQITFLQLVIILSLLGTAVARNSNAQGALNTAVTVKADSEKFCKVLTSLEEQSRVRFIYSSAIINSDRIVSVSAKRKPLKEVLDELLPALELTYQVTGDVVLLKRTKNEAEELVTEQASINVSGKVTDEKGETLPGVSVKVAGTTVGTVTDVNGNFSIAAAEGSSLVFSYIGFETQTLAVKNARMNVVMRVDVAGTRLSEVVVVGYGTQKRSDITGSVTSVPKERLSQLPVTNVLQAVQGAAPGITITQGSSVPGAQPNALVRGQTSFNSNPGPYIVVDGIPLTKTGGSLNDINPNDIASMEILKDASATAIYGTNGSQGVILITTKRGTTGKPVIRYNAYAGVENMANILDPRSPQEYVQKYADWKFQTTGQAPTTAVPNARELPNYQAGKTTDWLDLVTKQGVLQDHNLSISGGTEDVKYFVSGDYLDQKGVVQGYQYKRASIRTNIDANISKILNVGTTLFVTHNNTDGGRANLLNATAMSPYGDVYEANGNYAIFPMFPEQLFANPLLGLTTDRRDRKTNLNANAFGEVKILNGLKYRMNAGYSFIPAQTANYVGRLANDNNGTATVFSSETNSYTLENILSYNRDWQKHHIDVTALYSAQQRKYLQSEAGAVGFVNDELSFNKLEAGATQSSKSYSDRYALNSQMGRINYSYNSKYLLTLTARRDGSSVFGSNTTKYGIFPSVALGWNISNESFFKSLTFVDNLKLRLSYGKSGNEAISVYQTITSDVDVRYPFNGVAYVGAIPDVLLGNNDLKWETTLGKNVGVDFSFNKARFTGSVDFYDNKTFDNLLRRNLPIVTGYTTVWDNLGEVANRGLELSLNTKNIVKGDFRWETGANFSHNKNKITDIYGNKQSDIGNRWFIGESLGVVYDYKMEGVWQQGEDPAAQDPGAKPGDLKFADLNKDGKITDQDRTVLGQTSPKWIGGLTNTFHYKSLNLNIFIQTLQGITRNNPDLTYADETGRRNTPAAVGYWTADNKSNTRPALSYNNTRGYGYASDASYTRIKDATLSYVFPSALLQKVKLSGLTVYASGRNLYTFTNWIGWDPESNQNSRGSGDWNNNYPLTRSFVFGANISLR